MNETQNSKYLKNEPYYNNLYDRITVEKCRGIEDFHKSYKPSKDLAEEASKGGLKEILKEVNS